MDKESVCVENRDRMLEEYTSDGTNKKSLRFVGKMLFARGKPEVGELDLMGELKRLTPALRTTH